MSTSTSSVANASIALPTQRRPLTDWLFAVLVVAAAVWGWRTWGGFMAVYEKSILVGMVPSLIALGWFWRPVQGLTVASGAATLLAATLYLRVTDDHGRIFDGKGTVGRYVRLYSNGNTSDELNHYCEVEVHGTLVK